jgi:hypothetical protein
LPPHSGRQVEGVEDQSRINRCTIEVAYSPGKTRAANSPVPPQGNEYRLAKAAIGGGRFMNYAG